MTNVIESAIKNGHGNAILYAGAIGLVLADSIPTPADGLFFNLEKKLRDQWESGKLTPNQYWWRQAGIYYVPNIIWWSLVLGAVVLTGKDFNQKWKIGLGLISGGAVIAIIHKNIQKDKERLGLKVPIT